MDEAVARSRSWLIGWLLFGLVLALYLRSRAPGLLPGDAGEFQFAAWRLGLAHATGYPLYLLLGSGWQHLLALLGIEPAAALNGFSAVIGAVAVLLFYHLMLRWLPLPANLRLTAALFSAALLAANPTFWSQNLIAEVYALHVLLMVLIFLAFQQCVTPGVQNTEPRITRRFVLLAFLIGLGLTHHAMTILLIPPLLMALTVADRTWWRAWRRVVLMLFATGLPLLFYLYIPLRSGPTASPWYHQQLGDDILSLYGQGWPGFVDFVSGRSISVGFYPLSEAVANLGQAWRLWQLHFSWSGLALALFGIFALWRQRQWPLLSLTVGYVLLQQTFNLFYAIGDILVYYIPLYLMAALWAGFGLHALAGSLTAAAKSQTSGARAGALIALLFLLLPISLVRDYYPRLDQTTATGARQQWNEILAAQPPADATLVSNDRNEIVPLFYLQAVEGQVLGLTGLFPLIEPGARFADVGATIETALQANAQPIYLIKPMPGLEVKFTLTAATLPLVRVEGMAAANPPQIAVDQALGPLQLIGYDWRVFTDTVQIDLHWAVSAPLDADYTTTVQLFDAHGEKVGQDDRAPGGVYYPTSHWKVGERLLDTHTINLDAERQPTQLLVGMYHGPEATPLAPPLQLSLALPTP